MPAALSPASEKPKIFIGVNGGHHHSTAVGIDVKSGIYSEVRGLPLNFHNSIPGSESRLRLNSLLVNLAKEFDLIPSDLIYDLTEHLVVALPGAISFRKDSDEKCYDALHDLLSDFKKWEVVDDTWAGLYAGTGQALGICGYASVGASVSVALGEFIAEKRYKLDGWGPIIGDHGSSFDITCDYFRQLGRQLDSMQESQSFAFVQEFINQHRVVLVDGRQPLGLPKLRGMEEVQEWFDDLKSFAGDGQWLPIFAQISIPIIRFAEQHPTAIETKEIISRNASRFADSVLLAIETFEPGDGFPVILQGGLIRNSSIYSNAVIQKLAKHGYKAEAAKAKPAIGALMLAVDGITESEGSWTFHRDSGSTGTEIRRRVLERVSQRLGS